MEIIYFDSKVEQICCSLKTAQKFFGGNRSLALSLLDRIQELKAAPTLKEIFCCGNSMRFHNLRNSGKRDYDGLFSVDVKTRKQPWRIILQPLNEDKKHLRTVK